MGVSNIKIHDTAQQNVESLIMTIVGLENNDTQE